MTLQHIPRLPGIYAIRCIPTGKLYIGSSAILRKRLGAHICLLKRGLHHSVHLQRAWNKYGANKFLFEVVLLCGEENLLMYEQLVLDAMQPKLNILSVAGSNVGHPASAERRKKSSETMKRRFLDPTKKKEAADRLARMRVDSEFEAARKAGHAAAMARKKAAKVVVPEETRAKIRATKRATLDKYVVEGKELCLPEISELYGITVYTFRARLNRGWSIDRAATEPVRPARTHK
jgi:group I intron endonuclease